MNCMQDAIMRNANSRAILRFALTIIFYFPSFLPIFGGHSETKQKTFSGVQRKRSTVLRCRARCNTVGGSKYALQGYEKQKPELFPEVHSSDLKPAGFLTQVHRPDFLLRIIIDSNGFQISAPYYSDRIAQDSNLVPFYIAKRYI